MHLTATYVLYTYYYCYYYRLISSSLTSKLLYLILTSIGSVTQIRESAAAFVRLAKTHDIAVILLGHVTKSGEGMCISLFILVYLLLALHIYHSHVPILLVTYSPLRILVCSTHIRSGRPPHTGAHGGHGHIYDGRGAGATENSADY